MGDTVTKSPSTTVPVVLPAGPSGTTYWPIRSMKRPHATVFLDSAYRAGYPNGKGVPTNRAVLGFWHPSTDMNGAGACCADQGDPCHAIRDGVVEFVGLVPGPAGNVLVLRFQVEGKTYWARYMHVQFTGKTGTKTAPKVGQTVKAHDVLAFIGRGGVDSRGVYYWDCAHLDFGIFHTRPPSWGWWPTRNGPASEVTAYCTDPDAFLRRLGAVAP